MLKIPNDQLLVCLLGGLLISDEFLEVRHEGVEHLPLLLVAVVESVLVVDVHLPAGELQPLHQYRSWPPVPSTGTTT